MSSPEKSINFSGTRSKIRDRHGACPGMSGGRALRVESGVRDIGTVEPETGIEIGRPGESSQGAAANDAQAGSGDEPDLTDVAAEFVWVMAPTRAAPRRFGALFRTGFLSLFVHVAVVGLILRFMQAPTPVAEIQETAVEIVQEAPPAPKPPETVAKQAGPAKVESKAPEPPKPEAPPEKPKQEEAKQVPPAGKPPEAAKVEPPRKPEPPQPKPDAAKEAEDGNALQAMQDELAALRAQKDGLQKQAEAAEEQAKAETEQEQREAALAQTAADTAKALGPLPQSFQAVALPGGAATGEDAVTYQQQVFSQLAKAKKAGRHVVSPGIAHVVFHVDGEGKLLDVTLDHPSGDAFLDAEAVAIVRRAAPFPPPPPGEQRAFSASMKFVVEE